MTRLMIAALLLASQPALATQVAEVRVPIADLNLNSPAGVQALDQRLARAASRLCGAAGIRPSFEHWSVRSCRRDALARVRPARDAAIARASRTEQLAAR